MNKFENKVVLVTGSTGLIGSNLVKTLVEVNGIKIIANGRSEAKLKKVFKNYLKFKGLRLYAHDVCNRFELNEKIDYIFHAAGPQENEIIINHPTEVISANILGLLNCFELVKTQKNDFKNNCRLVLFSSITVYNNKDSGVKIFKEFDTYLTDDLSSPKVVYSESKRMCEVISHSYISEFDYDVVIARLSTVYGHSEIMTKTAFFEFISNAISGNDIEILNPNLPKRDNIYIDDAVSGLMTVALNGDKGNVYNISSNMEMDNFASIYDMAKIIVDFVNKANISRAKLISSDSDNTEKSSIVLDNTKLRGLGWKITKSLKDGIVITLLQYLENNDKNKY